MENHNLIKILQAGDKTIEYYYLQYVNDFVATENFASYFGLSVDGANLVINQGRFINANKVPLELTITRKDFLNWYYINISDKQWFDLIESIYNDVKENLLNCGEYIGFTVEDIFNSLDSSQIENIPIIQVSGYNKEQSVANELKNRLSE